MHFSQIQNFFCMFWDCLHYWRNSRSKHELRNLLLSLSTYQTNKLKIIIKYFTSNFFGMDKHSLVFLRVFILIVSIFTIHLILLSAIMSLSFMKEPTEGSRANQQVSNERSFISPRKQQIPKFANGFVEKQPKNSYE